MLRVAIPIFDQLLITSFSLPIEMLNAAQAASYIHNRQSSPLIINLVGLNMDAVEATGGLQIAPQVVLDYATHYDWVIIPGLWRNPRPILKRYAKFVPWLAHQHQRGAKLIGAGTGCCFLAETGLLDGQPATTHWYYFDKFARHYPQVELQRQHFITRANRIYCAGSVNSLADLTVHLIGSEYGNSVAHQVERHFSHEIRQNYDSRVYSKGSHHYHSDEEILQCQLWLQDNLDEAITIAQLAEQVGMNSRTLNRRFQQAIGQSPLQYLQELRMESGKDLLKNTNLSIAEVALSVGYQDPPHFARLFKRQYNLSPSEYRQTIRGKLFSLQINADT